MMKLKELRNMDVRTWTCTK